MHFSRKRSLRQAHAWLPHCSVVLWISATRAGPARAGSARKSRRAAESFAPARTSLCRAGEIVSSLAVEVDDMNRRLIRYKAKPERADENQRLIEAVFQELRAKKPDGVRYMVLRMADDSFAHFVELEAAVNPLQALESFRRFSSTAGERAQEGPFANDATVIGDYRMLEKT
jgi:hypothetical protein